MIENELTASIVEIGKRLWMRGYIASNDGNISAALNEHEVLTTPTGVSKGFMTAEMIVKVDRVTGEVIAGNSQYAPSSELMMHLAVYRERPDVLSVVHAHPPFATSFAVAGIQLDKAVLPEAILVLGAVPVVPYGLPSTMEIPDSIRTHIKKSDVLLLQNHGALTAGTDVLNAYYKMETLEHTASIVWKAIQLGNVNVLSEYERDRLMTLREKYHLKGRIVPCDSVPMTIKQIPEKTIVEIVQRMISEIGKQG